MNEINIEHALSHARERALMVCVGGTGEGGCFVPLLLEAVGGRHATTSPLLEAVEARHATISPLLLEAVEERYATISPLASSAQNTNEVDARGGAGQSCHWPGRKKQQQSIAQRCR